MEELRQTTTATMVPDALLLLLYIHCRSSARVAQRAHYFQTGSGLAARPHGAGDSVLNDEMAGRRRRVGSTPVQSVSSWQSCRGRWSLVNAALARPPASNLSSLCVGRRDVQVHDLIRGRIAHSAASNVAIHSSVAIHSYCDRNTVESPTPIYGTLEQKQNRWASFA